MAADMAVVTKTARLGQPGAEALEGFVSGESYSLVGIRQMLNNVGDEDARAMVKACEDLWAANGWDKWLYAVVLVD